MVVLSDEGRRLKHCRESLAYIKMPALGVCILGRLARLTSRIGQVEECSPALRLLLLACGVIPRFTCNLVGSRCKEQR
jgi:hypothetical protein